MSLVQFSLPATPINFYTIFTKNNYIMDTGQRFLESTARHFSQYKTLGDKTFVQLTDDEMHKQPGKESNSVAIIIQHLHGNMVSRWTNFLTEDGEKPWRKRDEEFEEQSLTKYQLLNLWNEGWNALFHSLSLLAPEHLNNTVTIRKEVHSVIDAILRQISHVSYHVGQIVLLGKWIKDEQWQTLSIPKRGSAAFNEKMMGRNL